MKYSHDAQIRYQYTLEEINLMIEKINFARTSQQGEVFRRLVFEGKFNDRAELDAHVSAMTKK